ncbi:hypothetical protein ACQKEM_00950 [Pseudomonas sp. NPDC077382]
MRREEGGLLVEFDGHKIRISSADSEFDIESENFAAILSLPLAMARNRNISVLGRGDPLLARNLNALSKVWEAWLPEMFSEVEVRFSQDSVPGESGSKKDLVLYSGGVDSTHNVLSRIKNKREQDLLTVHGMDYRYKDRIRFDELVEKVQALVTLSCDKHYLIHTDAYEAYADCGIRGGVGHVFVLASMLFLFENRYRTGEIAADCSRVGEYHFWPWGTNSVTNELFAGLAFCLVTADQNIDRIQKMELLASSNAALSSLSVCKDYSFRPGNCGVCSKCMRTKLHFQASVGYVPSIFSNNEELGEAGIRWLAERGKREHVFIFQAYHYSRKKGLKVKGLDEVVLSLKRDSVKEKSFWNKLGALPKSWGFRKGGK